MRSSGQPHEDRQAFQGDAANFRDRSDLRTRPWSLREEASGNQKLSSQWGLPAPLAPLGASDPSVASFSLVEMGLRRPVGRWHCTDRVPASVTSDMTRRTVAPFRGGSSFHLVLHGAVDVACAAAFVIVTVNPLTTTNFVRRFLPEPTLRRGMFAVNASVTRRSTSTWPRSSNQLRRPRRMPSGRATVVALPWYASLLGRCAVALANLAGCVAWLFGARASRSSSSSSPPLTTPLTVRAHLARATAPPPRAGPPSATPPPHPAS